MAKLDPKSTDAIRIYMLLAGAVSGFLLTYFLIVPIMKDTCTWFTARCSRITVQRGPNNALLVTMDPYTYYYDGIQNIYAYGESLGGKCPQVVASGVQPQPVIAPPIQSFCFRWKPTPDDPKCVAGLEKCGPNPDPACLSTVPNCAVCADPVTIDPRGTCARAASPVTGTNKFTCDGTTQLDKQQCCEYIPPCANGGNCNLSVPAQKQADGTLHCDTGILDGDVCNTRPRYVQGQGYTCDGVKFTTQPECCNCSTSFTAVTYAGETDAVNVYEPVFAMNAKTMTLVPLNNGVVCGIKKGIVLEQFKEIPKQAIKVNLPEKDAMLDVYQVFDVLRSNGIFHTP